MENALYLKESFWVNVGPTQELAGVMNCDDSFLKVTSVCPPPSDIEFYDYFWDKDYRTFACCMKYFHIRRKIIALLEDEHDVHVEDTPELMLDVALQTAKEVLGEDATFDKYRDLWHCFDALIESETVTKEEFVEACDKMQNLLNVLPGYEFSVKVYDSIEELGKSINSFAFQEYKKYFTKENFSEDMVFEFLESE